MTQRDGMGREVGGGFRMGNTCTPMANSCQCMAKPLQYCKVISLQLNKLKRKKKKEKDAGEVATLATVHTKCAVLVAMSVFPLPIPEAGEAVCSVMVPLPVLVAVPVAVPLK